MAYSRTNWKDKVVSTPNKYKDQNNVSYTFTPDEGTVTEAGTPVNAGNLNKIDLTLYINNNIFACTGSANTYATTIAGITALTNLVGIPFAISLNVDASSASTLNVNSYGAKSILKPNGVAFANGKKNGIYTMIWNGTNFILQGSDSAGNATPADLYHGKTASTDAGDITGTLSEIPYTMTNRATPYLYKFLPVHEYSNTGGISCFLLDSSNNMYLQSNEGSTIYFYKINTDGGIVWSTTGYPNSNLFLINNFNDKLYTTDMTGYSLRRMSSINGTAEVSINTNMATITAITCDNNGNIYAFGAVGAVRTIKKYTSELVFVSSTTILNSYNNIFDRVIEVENSIYALDRTATTGKIICINNDLSAIDWTYTLDAGLDIAPYNSSICYAINKSGNVIKVIKNGAGGTLSWTSVNYTYTIFLSKYGVYLVSQYNHNDQRIIPLNGGSAIQTGISCSYQRNTTSPLWSNGMFYTTSYKSSGTSYYVGYSIYKESIII